VAIKKKRGGGEGGGEGGEYGASGLGLERARCPSVMFTLTASRSLERRKKKKRRKGEKGLILPLAALLNGLGHLYDLTAAVIRRVVNSGKKEKKGKGKGEENGGNSGHVVVVLP